jgi:hypothetical protein
MPEKKQHPKRTQPDTPETYQPLKGSERPPSKTAKLLGPADPQETFSVTIVLRRRPDGPAIPSFDYFAKTPLSQRRRMAQEEFAAKYGAAAEDINEIVEFAVSHGLTVVETHAGRRTVVVSGTVAQMSKAFGVTLGRYERVTSKRRGKRVLPYREVYRGREGAIHVPKNLAEVIVGVFGLDTRRISHSHVTPADPPDTGQVSVQQVTELYDFPSPGPSITGQTIGIIAPTGGFGGYLQSDLNEYFASIGATAITPIPVSIDNIANGTSEETTIADAPAATSTLVFPLISNLPLYSIGEFSIGGTYYYIEVTNVTSTATSTTVTVEVYDFATNSFVTTGFPTDVPAGTTVFFNLDGETTQDICISGSAALGANVAVYFSKDTEAGWIDLLARAIHPNAGDFPAGVNPPSVLSASWIIGCDDPDGMALFGITTSVIEAMDAAFQDAALQGLTVCVASGDAGTFGQVSDGYAHAYYPASDPWVLSVGGTTVGQYSTGSSLSWVEFLWNDTFFGGEAGATGGGISDLFPVPSYQSTAGVPNSINKTINPAAPFNTTGRGYPDVAGNASPNSGYPMFVGGGADDANGTSASTPLWAALVATINSNLGFNVGFVNPILYALGSTAFNPISPLWPDPALPQLATCPTTNGINGILGYTAGPGWDACTGWGSPNGTTLLSAIKSGLVQDCYFIVDTGVYDEGAVQAGITASGSDVFQEAFFVVIEGFTANQLGITAATVANAVSNPPTVQPALTGFPSGMSVSLVSVQPAEALSSSGLNSPQRFTYAYNVTFTSTSAFPTTTGATSSLPVTATVSATVNSSPVTVSSGAVFDLIKQPGPYLAGGSGISWLSSDIRVFQVEPGEWAVPDPPYSPLGTGIALGNTGNPAVDATTFIQNVIQSLNSGTNLPPASTDPSPGGPVRSYFDLLPTGEDVSELDLLPLDPVTHQPVYNFALARVRYNSSAITATNVRAFFRLIPALNVSVAFEPTTTYRRWTAGPQAIPLYGLDSTGEVISIPCFAEPRVNATAVSVESQTDPANIQTIPATGGEVDVYFGCWLDINQSTGQYPSTVGLSNPDGPFAASSLQTIQQLMRNEHQCLMVEIDYAPDPIVVGSSPSTSGPLAQRNLTLGNAANPGESASRRVPNTFMIRPTPVSFTSSQRPDELMIDWRNVPAGSVASIYWPQVSAAQVLALAAELYTTHNLTMTDSHTLQVPVGGITYIPIPAGTTATLPGLISVDLPLGIRKGQSFNVVVRQVTSTSQKQGNIQVADVSDVRVWRRILGSFQMTILVSTKDVMLAPEERSLSVMRWIQQSIPASDRWFPVIQRYVNQIAARVSALGGNPTTIVGSSTGGVTALPPGGGGQPTHSEPLEFTGKVNGLKYNHFGDFEGFYLRIEHGGEHWFESREHEIEILAQRAWSERIPITVFAGRHTPHQVESMVLRGFSRLFHH